MFQGFQLGHNPKIATGQKDPYVPDFQKIHLTLHWLTGAEAVGVLMHIVGKATSQSWGGLGGGGGAGGQHRSAQGPKPRPDQRPAGCLGTTRAPLLASGHFIKNN